MNFNKKEMVITDRKTYGMIFDTNPLHLHLGLAIGGFKEGCLPYGVYFKFGKWQEWSYAQELKGFDIEILFPFGSFSRFWGSKRNLAL